MKNESVTQMFPRPKRVKVKHRGQNITVVFNPETRKWGYEIIVTVPGKIKQTYEGYSSEGRAHRYAKEAVNTILDGER